MRVILRICHLGLLVNLILAFIFYPFKIQASLPFEEGSNFVIFNVASTDAGVAHLDFYNGFVYFTENSAHKIGRIDIETEAVQDYSLHEASAPLDLRVIDEENIWFTCYDSPAVENINGIAKFNLSTLESVYYILDATPNAGITNLVFDAEGNIWFTEFLGNKIGKLDPEGSYTEFDIPTENSSPTGIDIDASGNIWFTESAADKIGKFDPSVSEFTEYEISSSALPWDLVVSDTQNRVWFTERGLNAVGYMDLDGTNYNEIDGSGYSQEPHKLYEDNNGRIWGADKSRNVVAFYQNQSLYGLYGDEETAVGFNELVEDSQGNIWIAAQNTGQLYRLDYIAPQIDHIDIDVIDFSYNPLTDTLTGTAVFSVQASDNTKVKRVDFYLDEELVYSDATNDFSWIWEAEFKGGESHTIYIYAYDAANNWRNIYFDFNADAFINQARESGIQLLPQTGSIN